MKKDYVAPEIKTYLGREVVEVMGHANADVYGSQGGPFSD